MKLKEFEIKSYRSCIKTKLVLNTNLTGLIGINGAGKSNLLSSILLLPQLGNSRYRPHREDTFFNRCNINVGIEDEGKTISMRGQIVFETDDKNRDEVQNSSLKWNTKSSSERADWVSVPIEMLDERNRRFFVENRSKFISLARQQSLFDPALDEKMLNTISKTVNFFNGIKYYSASQFSDPSRCPVSLELDENRFVRKTRTTLGHEQFIMDLYKSYKLNDKQYKRYINSVNENGISLVDEIAFNEVEMPSSSYEVKSGGKIKQIERNRTLIVPSFSVEGNNLSPNQLSEGTFKTLALIFYVLTDESTLLMIEEPEVCVHHGLLNSIMELIKMQSKNKQIIISTHSDYVLDHLDPENLILINREKDKGTTAKELNKALSKNDYQALKTYLKESGNLGEYWRDGGLDYES